MSRIQAFQISTGLGAGNLGDDLMAQAFWNHLPSDLELEVAVFPESARLREAYPVTHVYRTVEWHGNENRAACDVPALLVGDTPVTDAEGLHWPMQFLARRLQHFHDLGQPVDAIGVGVDHLGEPDALRIFRESFLPIRSWTVRSQACKDALIGLGVAESQVRVGADLGWLYECRRDLRVWAQGFWRKLQIDPVSPLLVVNVVNMQWQDRADVKRALAEALDWASDRLALQIAFFCNECRPGPFFDFAAALEVMAFMKNPAVVVPNEYYSPGEAIALLACATITMGQRYHFLLESVLAGSVPVGALRGEKMRDLASELSIPVAGMVDDLDKDQIVLALQQAVENRSSLLRQLASTSQELSRRAVENLSFLRTSSEYADAKWVSPQHSKLVASL